MVEGDLEDPADYASSDIPNRFDISGYRNGLFGGPGADLFGEPGMAVGGRAGSGSSLNARSSAASASSAGSSRGGGSVPPNPGPPSNPGLPSNPGPPSNPGRSSAGHRAPEPGPRPSAGRAAIPDSGPSASNDGWSQPQLPSQLPPPDPVTETGSLVRPYTRTGGRTRPDYDLAIEGLVSTSDSGWEMEEALLPEHRAICSLCMDTKSVAEVAAHLRLPLGVVRVLIGDMAGMGLVVIHSTDAIVGDRPSMEFLERVLSGLRRL
ncbi:MAG TPA: DUF742 domain-containing protein [Pseudonocardiaceae bacterium]|nr:DUF742 domain-containing protein [Pseudonocardiaceae bacterium]